MDKPFTVFSLVVLLLFGMTVAQYKLTGAVTAEVGVNVVCLVAISLPVSTADFGQISQGATDNTTDNSPPPMVVQNDGGALVDVTIARANSSAALFNGTGGGDNTTSFRFKARDPNATSFNASSSITAFTNVPNTTPVTFLRQLRFAAGHKKAFVDLLIKVPADEPPGEKSELLDFIALQSNGTSCGADVQSQSECIVFDLDNAKVVGPDKKLVDVTIENTCSFPVTITKAKLTWTDPASIEQVKIDGNTQWSSTCGWGCSPAGVQPSGTLLDFGSEDKTISGGQHKQSHYIFDAAVDGSTFSIELTMLDSSIASSGFFIAS